MLKEDGIYYAYLRKSREDHIAEKNGAEDTLARHEFLIKELAARNHIQISRWYKEVVSGETISDRPEMLHLLSDIEMTAPDGVLVVEVERLSRGNPQDQGRVMDTFKYSNTLIITPMKIYDLNQESDEEWIDFGLLRSRMEYRTIKRRMQNGRLTSAMQGKFIGNKTPYGWIREKLKGEKGYTLIPDPETSQIVKLMYQLVTTGNESTGWTPVGTPTVARMLDDMGIPTPRGSAEWECSAISKIIQNPVNIGMVRIGHRKEVKRVVDGVMKKSRPLNHDAVLVPARWEGIVEKDVYDRACSRFAKYARLGTFVEISNPMAGVVRCKLCGRPMSGRPSPKRNMLFCRTRNCPTVGAYTDLVEERLVASLENFLVDYKLHVSSPSLRVLNTESSDNQAILNELHAKLDKLNTQYKKICTLFEQDVYDIQTYLTRSQDVKNEIAAVNARIGAIDGKLAKAQQDATVRKNFIPYFEYVLASYKESTDPKYKNKLLKEIVTSVDYSKTVRAGRNGKGMDSFVLDVHINLQAHPMQ